MTSDEFGSRYRLLKQMAVKEGRSYTAEHVSSGRAVLVHILEEERFGGTNGLKALLERLAPRHRSRVLETLTVDGSLVVVTQFLQGFDGFEAWLRGRTAESVGPPPAPANPAHEVHGDFTRLFRSTEDAAALPTDPLPPVLDQPPSGVSPGGSNFTDLFRAPARPPEQGATIPPIRMVGVRVPLPSEPPPASPSLPPPESGPPPGPPRLSPNFAASPAAPAPPDLAGWPRPEEVIIRTGESASAPLPHPSWGTGAPSEYTRMFGSVPQPTGELARPVSEPEPREETPERKRSYIPLFLVLNLVFILATGLILYFALRRC